MSKSLGNFIAIRSILKDFPGEVVRLCLLKAHYREDVEYDRDCFEITQREYDAMRRVLVQAKEAHGSGSGGKVDELVRQTKSSFVQAMDDDFNTPDAIYRLQQATEALNEIDDLSRDEGRAVVNLYREAGQILGLFHGVA
jgi:cysteinyl-tRNA synthetase